MPWIFRMTLLAALVTLPLHIYVGRRLATAISTIFTRFKNPRQVKLLIVYPVLSWIYLFPFILGFSYLSGDFMELFVFSPTLGWQDYLVMYPFWWGVVSSLEITPFFILLDFIRLTRRWKKIIDNKKQPQWKWDSYIKIVVVLIVFIYAAVRIPWDTGHVRITRSIVHVKNLPQEYRGLQICFLGDLHVDRYTGEDKLVKVKEILKSGEDDLILFSGDLVSRGMDYISRVLKVMRHPKSKTKAIAIMGDHDYWTARFEIPRLMERAGWRFLEDAHRVIPYKGRQILVTGVTYIYSKRITEGELRLLLSKAPSADLKILLVHQPMEMIVRVAAEYGYHLFLAGHTHGGQIVTHLFGFPVSVGQGETPYCWGTHRVGDMTVIVTNGVGLTLAPIRYHAPSEICRLILE